MTLVGTPYAYLGQLQGKTNSSAAKPAGSASAGASAPAGSAAAAEATTVEARGQGVTLSSEVLSLLQEEVPASPDAAGAFAKSRETGQSLLSNLLEGGSSVGEDPFSLAVSTKFSTTAYRGALKGSAYKTLATLAAKDALSATVSPSVQLEKPSDPSINQVATASRKAALESIAKTLKA